MRRLNFLLTGLLAVLPASCNQRVQNIENKPAVKIDTVLSADKQTALQFPGRVKSGSGHKPGIPGERNYPAYVCE